MSMETKKPALCFNNRKQPALSQEKKFKQCLKKGGAKEWGSFELQPYSRQEHLKRKAEKAGLSLAQAISYRQGLMKNKNRLNNTKLRPNKDLGLPLEQIIQEKATSFEKKVEMFLKKKNISFCTEADLRRTNQQDKKFTTTPDFFFEEPLLVCVDGVKRWIRWLEVKWFYGSADKTRFRQKQILETAKRYQQQRGQGLMVFAFGFAKELRTQLRPHALCVDWCSVVDTF